LQALSSRYVVKFPIVVKVDVRELHGDPAKVFSDLAAELWRMPTAIAG
jgi:hypothetical protein